MPIPLEMTLENIEGLQYHYDLIRSFPRPVIKENEHCLKFGHTASWIIIDKKMRLRKEYANNKFCVNCHLGL